MFKVSFFKGLFPDVSKQVFYLHGLKRVCTVLECGQGLADQVQAALGLGKFFPYTKFILVELR